MAKKLDKNEYGWVLYGEEGYHGKGVLPFSNHNDDTWRIGTTGYLRFHWCDFEPEENAYRWELIDQPLKECTDRGKRFAFGIIPMNSCISLDSATPSYVFEGGARYDDCEVRNNFTGGVSFQKAPVWDDPVFMQKTEKYIQALADKYDGHPGVAFIDIRNCGNWGEWHIGGLKGASVIREDNQYEHISMWLKAFRNTRLILPVNGNESTPISRWAVEQGVGLRRDGIIRLPEDHKAVSHCTGKVPSVGEFWAKY